MDGLPAPSSSTWGAMLLSAFLGLMGIYFVWKQYRTRNRQRNGKAAPMEWRSAQSYRVDVTLDPNTAYPHLVLRKDLKSVHLEDSRQQLPDRPERFDTWPCVLGRETFTSGRHYWEVEVGGRTDWLVGVCRENVLKKEFILMSPKSGFWVMELSQEEYWALNPSRVLLSLPKAPRRIGIFLDYESGIVSFYNVSAGIHIYTFPKASFSDPIRPLFCLWSCGKSPMTIC